MANITRLIRGLHYQLLGEVNQALRCECLTCRLKRIGGQDAIRTQSSCPYQFFRPVAERLDGFISPRAPYSQKSGPISTNCTAQAQRRRILKIYVVVSSQQSWCCTRLKKSFNTYAICSYMKRLVINCSTQGGKETLCHGLFLFPLDDD